MVGLLFGASARRCAQSEGYWCRRVSLFQLLAVSQLEFGADKGVDGHGSLAPED
jgi:hypothetical protein